MNQEDLLVGKKILRTVFWENKFIISTDKGIYVVNACEPSAWSENHHFIIDRKETNELEPGILMELGYISFPEYHKEMVKRDIEKAKDDIEYYKQRYPELF